MTWRRSYTRSLGLSFPTCTMGRTELILWLVMETKFLWAKCSGQDLPTLRVLEDPGLARSSFIEHPLHVRHGPGHEHTKAERRDTCLEKSRWLQRLVNT